MVFSLYVMDTFRDSRTIYLYFAKKGLKLRNKDNFRTLFGYTINESL